MTPSCDRADDRRGERRFVMKSLIYYAAAAAVSVGAWSFAPTVRADDTTVGQKVDNAAEKTKNAAENAADKTKDAARDAKGHWDQGRIHTMLKQVTEASLTKGGFNDVVERFNDADRNRIGPWVKDKANKAKLDILDGRIAQFQKDWKAKYGQDFNIKNDKVVFGNDTIFKIQTGQIGKDAQVAGEKLPPAENVTKDNLKTDAKDRNLEQGRNVAYVVVAESHSMPELKVPLIHELPDLWKIDVPDAVDGQKLYDNLLTHLTMANEAKDKWPDDVNDAYRAVAHHILMAVMDVSHHDAVPAAAKLGGDTAKPAK
jgi:hypothetical protein